jgi:hypothetical protein
MAVVKNHTQNNITHLSAGGLITNYYCTSMCRHCLYACHPGRDKTYITDDVLEKNARKVLDLGCSSLHVGGGEPFLDIPGLKRVIRGLTRMGIHIEYVETNSSWFKDSDHACGLLTELQETGLSTLLISMSPFHNEHIPFSKVKGVLDACRKTGMGIFPWVEAFYPEINEFDPGKKHSLTEYTEKYGKDYIEHIPRRYWVTFRGRALSTYKHYMKLCPLEEIFSAQEGGCRDLFQTSHFHVDCDGNYLPGLCPGLSIACEDLGSPLDPEKYPVITRLMSSGVKELCRYAEKEYRFVPGSAYVSPCDLCTDIRVFLVKQEQIDTRELQPAEFYDYI